MENREDFLSILPYLPLILRSNAVFWPPLVVEALKSLSKGPSHSNVNSGQLFALAVSDLRSSLGECTLFPSASLGFSVFFDDLMSKDEAGKWFTEVVPRLSDLLLRLPELLETHYQNEGSFCGMESGLRLLESQQPGIVLLSQELIAALLVCALFCLFPTTDRRGEHLPPINFDNLFACLYECYDVNQEHKIKCLVHYFETICLTVPLGNVSFERKVLPLKNSRSHIAYPEPDFWSKSTVSLCQFKVCYSGLIEDQSVEALEVDFANKYIGGGALSRGCVQEEIRFMINPELIVSMLFLPSMADNEAIEIVGAQRFSNYSGYAKSFRFCGHHEDNKSVDAMGRRKTRIIAIDALCSPGKRQYRLDCLLRETNKAFCGFLDQQKHQLRQNLFDESENSISTTEDLPASSPAHEQSRHHLETQSIKSQLDQRPSHDAFEVGPEPDKLGEDSSKYLRSLQMVNHRNAAEFSLQSIVDFQKFKLLRDLVMVGFKFQGRKLPKGITNLVHLRRLRLEKCEFDTLPMSIRNLVCMDTLDLTSSYNVEVLNVFKEMLCLKHLALPNYDEENIGGYRLTLDEGVDVLESLIGLDSRVHDLRCIARMKNLRRFDASIHDNESLLNIMNAIATDWNKFVCYMVYIKEGCELGTNEGVLNKAFTCPNLHSLWIQVKIGKAVCRRDFMSSKLTKLLLLECEIEDDPMGILGELPCLTALTLSRKSFVGEEMTCPSNSFPCLKNLIISKLPKFREWRVEARSMPLLSTLHIYYCSGFEMVPDGLSDISTLRELMIFGMPELGKRVSASGEDFHKVSHVPSIFIY